MAIKQYVYGSGEIYFAPFKPGTQIAGALRYLGNTPEFTLTSETEKLDHFDSDHGLKIKDDSVDIETNRSGTIVTDNIDYDNLSMLFLGTTSSITNASATASIDNIASVEFGTYQLGVTPALPTGVRKVSNVVVTDGTAGPTVTYVAGVDYVVDGDRGMIRFLEGGSLEIGDPVKITYDNAASTRKQVMASNKTVEGKVWFKSFNAKGPLHDYLIPWTKFSPNGDFNLKGDEWQQLPFSVEVLKLGELAPVYIDGMAETA